MGRLKKDFLSIEEDFLNIEEEFCKLDHENKVAGIPLHFEKPGDIFADCAGTTTPLVSADFIECLYRCFDFIPDKYKLDIHIRFDDMEGYTEEELHEIFRKNILLEAKVRFRLSRRQNRLALALCAVGLLFIAGYVLVCSLWEGESALKEIVTFVLEIAATVPFWGAMEVYFIDNSEKRKKALNIRRRFRSVTFEHAD